MLHTSLEPQKYKVHSQIKYYYEHVCSLRFLKTDQSRSQTASTQSPPSPHLAIPKLQVVQALWVILLADVGLVDDEVLPPALLSEQHTRVVPPQLWRRGRRRSGIQMGYWGAFP